MFQTKMKSDLKGSEFAMKQILFFPSMLTLGVAAKKRPFATFGVKLDLIMHRNNSLKQVDVFHLVCLHLCTVLVHGSDSCALLCLFGRGRLTEILQHVSNLGLFFFYLIHLHLVASR